MAEIAGNRGRRVQMRASRKDGWTRAKRARFLAVLGETCNVTAATRAAGVGAGSPHKLRLRDGEFSKLWDDALEAGYERLEAELLARALGQVSTGDNPDADEIAAVPVAHPFDPALAIKVLQLRGNRGIGARGATPATAGGAKPRTQGEIDAALLERLDALAARS